MSKQPNRPRRMKCYRLPQELTETLEVLSMLTGDSQTEIIVKAATPYVAKALAKQDPEKVALVRELIEGRKEGS